MPNQTTTSQRTPPLLLSLDTDSLALPHVMPSSPAIDFDRSGAGETDAGPISLKDVQQTCVDLGFVKQGVADTKPLAQRANVADFFKALGVTSLSGFKARFYGEKLPQPYVGQEPLVAEKVT